VSDFSPRFVSVRMKAWWLALAFLSGLAVAMLAEDLLLSWHDNRLEFSAPRLHFLTGKPLDRLHNAADVPFDFQITLWSDNRGHLFKRTAARFMVSYDVWEETFSVINLQTPRKMASHLTDRAAEAWCLAQLPVDVAGLSDAQTFWARLEIRAQDSKEAAPLFGRGNISDSGISLTSLIEIFSRPAAGNLPHWTLDAGPLTIEELKRSNGRGS
jgi:hypothetical protein